MIEWRIWFPAYPAPIHYIIINLIRSFCLLCLFRNARGALLEALKTEGPQLPFRKSLQGIYISCHPLYQLKVVWSWNKYRYRAHLCPNWEKERGKDIQPWTKLTRAGCPWHTLCTRISLSIRNCLFNHIRQ